MTPATSICARNDRRHDVRTRTWYGIDSVDIDPDRRTLRVHFIGRAPEGIGKEHFRIEGGKTVRDIDVTAVEVHRKDDPELDDCMTINLDKAGDHSTYTLRLVLPEVHDGQNTGSSRGLDPRFSAIEFTFTINCPGDHDCVQPRVCTTEPHPDPEVSYLAKDYASFRQVILDRMSLLMPEWRERHVPDIGIALVELLAYMGDYLSYYQDAVATEAYLETARRRISVRRHVRLVDYAMHEGCNARAWVCVETDRDVDADLRGITFVTADPAAPVSGSVLAPEELEDLPGGEYEVFEPLVPNPESGMGTRVLALDDDEALRDLILQVKESNDLISRYLQREFPVDTRAMIDAYDGTAKPSEILAEAVVDDITRMLESGSITLPTLAREYNLASVIHFRTTFHAVLSRIPLYTWGGSMCCLPTGATGATLVDTSASKSDAGPRILKAGSILVFEEIRGPKTGIPDDADPSHRHAVRLTNAEYSEDPLNGTKIIEIQWASEDALPFPLCISSISDPPTCARIEDVSVARGNVIPVDHGRTIRDERLQSMPQEESSSSTCRCCGRVQRSSVSRQPDFLLSRTGITFSEPFTPDDPAQESLAQEPRRALPSIIVIGVPPQGSGQPTVWTPRGDLLSSGSDDAHFVVEVDDDGVAFLRFGDGDTGMRPEPGTEFAAYYRVGNGRSGNVGSGAISRIVSSTGRVDGIIRVWNPFPAIGGIDPEQVADVRQLAPGAFRSELQRAILPEDYARIAERHPKVQRAAAMSCWTGSWYEVVVAIDQKNAEEADESLVREIQKMLEEYRRVGHDLRVVPATFVPLDIAVAVCVKPGYFRASVKDALNELFSRRTSSDGRRGLFHPDTLTFGDSISTSRIVAAAMGVPGVDSITVTKLERLGEGPEHEIDEGVLRISPLEIAQLNNDPVFPDRGRFSVVEMRGGR